MERIKIHIIFTGKMRAHLIPQAQRWRYYGICVFAAETGSKFHSDDARRHQKFAGLLLPVLARYERQKRNYRIS
jgi:hypothetical protein